jgi:hypothetical protein
MADLFSDLTSKPQRETAGSDGVHLHKGTKRDIDLITVTYFLYRLCFLISINLICDLQIAIKC